MDEKKPSTGSTSPGSAPDSHAEAHTHATGAKRSEVMPFYSAIPAQSLRRVALRATGAPRGEVLTDAETGFEYHGGSRGYGYSNWALGLPFEDTYNHVLYHLTKWKAAIENGKLDRDDHLAAVAWAVLMPLMTFEQTYMLAFQKRIGLHMTGSATRPTPQELDAAMGELGKFIQKLSPDSPSVPERLRMMAEDCAKMQQSAGAPWVKYIPCWCISSSGYACGLPRGHKNDYCAGFTRTLEGTYVAIESWRTSDSIRDDGPGDEVKVRADDPRLTWHL